MTSLHVVCWKPVCSGNHCAILPSIRRNLETSASHLVAGEGLTADVGLAEHHAEDREAHQKCFLANQEPLGMVQSGVLILG